MSSLGNMCAASEMASEAWWRTDAKSEAGRALRVSESAGRLFDSDLEI